MSDLEQARTRWLMDAPEFKQFGKVLEARLLPEIRRLGIKAELSSREKEMHGLIKKLIAKPHHTYETLGDKCGVRVIVRYKPEVDIVLHLAQRLFDCGAPEYTSVRLAEDKVGYLSVHVDVKLRESDRDRNHFPGDRFRAELQIRTLAQHLWAEMAHDTSYKGAGELEEELKRRINLMAGLIEVADNEFSRINDDLSSRPGSKEQAVLKDLEKLYFKITTVSSNRDLSLEIIGLLLPLYRESPEQIGARIEALFNEKRDIFQSVFNEEVASAKAGDTSAFMFQPEVLLLYERLKNDSYRLKREFSKRYPIKELERIANTFGMSFD